MERRLSLARVQSLDPEFTSLVCFQAHRLGLIVFYVGTDSNVIEITPPLTISQEDISDGVEILGQAIEDVEAGVVSAGDLANYAGW